MVYFCKEVTYMFKNYFPLIISCSLQIREVFDDIVGRSVFVTSEPSQALQAPDKSLGAAAAFREGARKERRRLRLRAPVAGRWGV